MKVKLEVLEDFMSRSIYKWREIYLQEIKEDPSRKQVITRPSFDHFIRVQRPFFSDINFEDSHYIANIRTIEYTALKYNLSSKIVILRLSGYNLGRSMVKKGIIHSMDDVSMVLVLYKIGLVDLVKESFNTMKINIYECISCYDLPNVGKAMCDFEAGILQGILTELYGSNIVKEKYCWGLGNSFCGFEIYFE